MNKQTQIRFEVLLLALLIIICTITAIYFDAFELLVEIVNTYEDYELDELITLSMFLSIAFGVFSWRRLRDLKQEINQKELIEKQITHAAFHDSLTGLPNRRYFDQYLHRELADKQANNNISLMIIDLNKFKRINDTYGHHLGDIVLKQTAKRLIKYVNTSGFVARLGGDEFAVLTDRYNDTEHLKQFCFNLKNELSQPIIIDGLILHSGCSIGISSINESTNTASELLRTADFAMYQAKANPAIAIPFYDPSMDEARKKRQSVEYALRNALNNNQFTLFYQPQFNHHKHLVGFEALLRWFDPELGEIPPSYFIPLAEECGLIIPIGEWVLKEACNAVSQWPKSFFIAVNISSIQFQHFNFINTLDTIISQTGIKHTQLELEITESVLMQDITHCKQVVESIKKRNISIALDDFGTGYSSLSYLRQFPFNKLKIDRTFISDLNNAPKKSVITQAIIQMANSLHMTVTAEGIENETQWDELLKIDCQYFQGFHLGRPMPLENALALIHAQTQSHKAISIH